MFEGSNRSPPLPNLHVLPSKFPYIKINKKLASELPFRGRCKNPHTAGNLYLCLMGALEGGSQKYSFVWFKSQTKINEDGTCIKLRIIIRNKDLKLISTLLYGSNEVYVDKF